MTYEMDIAGLKRELPLCKLNDELCIGAFVMFGDVELTVHCAAELLKRAPEYDYIIAPEAKAIPLGYEMARQSAAERYFVARKGAKAYMQGTFEVNVKSITTMGVQRLVIDAEDAAFIKGKRMLIVDDVISTGESLHAVEELVKKAGGIVAGRMAVLAEGDAANRDDIIVLGKLPLGHHGGLDVLESPSRVVLHVWGEEPLRELLRLLPVPRPRGLAHPLPVDQTPHRPNSRLLQLETAQPLAAPPPRLLRPNLPPASRFRTPASRFIIPAIRRFRTSPVRRGNHRVCIAGLFYRHRRTFPHWFSATVHVLPILFGLVYRHIFIIAILVYRHR